jgi:hypothetical protein
MPVSEDLVTEINKAISEVPVASSDTTAPSVSAEKNIAPLATEEPSSTADLSVTQDPVTNPDETPKDEPTPSPRGGDTVSTSDASPKISDEALTRAVVAGISVADARSFLSDEALLRVVERVEGASRANNKADDKPKAEEDPFAGIKPLDPEVYEPAVISMFDTLLGVAKKQHEELKQFKASSDSSAASAAAAKTQEIERWFDENVTKLGDDFKGVLGTGPMAKLSRSSSEYAKRDEIANYIVVLKKGREGAGLQQKPLDELFHEAAQFVLRDEFLAVKEKRLAGDLADRSSQHISRATGQTGKKKETPEDATARILDEKYFKT